MSIRRKLIARRDSLIKEVSTQLTQSNCVEFADELRQIANYDILIKHVTPSYSPVLHAIAVALVCITVIGVAWTWPVSNSRVIVDVETEAVELRLSDLWEWRNLPAKQSALRLEQLTKVEVPSEGVDRAPPTLLNGHPWIDLRRGHISINGLNVEKEAVLRIHRAEDGFVYIHTLGAPMRGHFSVSGESIDISAGRERNTEEIAYSIKRTIPESLVFASEEVGMIPAVLRMRPEQPLVLAGIAVDGLSFSRQVSEKPGHTEFACTINSGTLHFSDTEQVASLEKGDCLSMHGEFGRIVELTIDDAVQLKFEGTVNQVEVGPEGFQRNITPTYLEWMYHNQRLSFLWGAVVFLWGMLWSLRKVFAT